jgi:hypothetical protein
MSGGDSGLSIWSGTQEAKTIPMSNALTVYALIYSGREDPSWELSGSDLETLRAKLAGLPKRKTRVVPGMGYQGFLLANLAELPGLPRRIHVYHGCISISDVGGKRQVYDDHHHVEAWLLMLACSLPFGREIQSVLAKSRGPVTTRPASEDGVSRLSPR